MNIFIYVCYFKNLNILILSKSSLAGTKENQYERVLSLKIFIYYFVSTVLGVLCFFRLHSYWTLAFIFLGRILLFRIPNRIGVAPCIGACFLRQILVFVLILPKVQSRSKPSSCIKSIQFYKYYIYRHLVAEWQTIVFTQKHIMLNC